MSIEHRERIERVLYRIVNELNHNRGPDYPDRALRLTYIIGYLIGLLSQLAADDSLVEGQLYSIIRRLEGRE